MDLQDKVIVITGASSGFGEQIARQCAQQGAIVVLVARSLARLEQLAQELGAQRVYAIPADVCSATDVAQMTSTVLERFGRVDVLVANAGFGILDTIADAPLSDLQAMVEVNVYGTVRCIQALLPTLRQHGGQVIVMASLAGLIATQNMGFYSATKFALVGLTRTLMLELAGTGVRCALICPGVAKTGFQHYADQAKYARITRFVSCTSVQVAQAAVRAMQHRTHGEVIVPRWAWLLVLLSLPIPRLSRLVIRLIG